MTLRQRLQLAQMRGKQAAAAGGVSGRGRSPRLGDKLFGRPPAPASLGRPRTAAAVLRLLGRWRPSGLQDTAISFRSLVNYSPQRFERLAREGAPHLPRLNLLQLSRVACAFAAAGHKDETFLTAVADAAAAKLRSGEPGADSWPVLSCLAVAFARLQLEPMDLLAAIATAARQLLEASDAVASTKYDGTHLSLLPWAFATLDLYDSSLFEELAILLKAEEHVMYLLDANDLLRLIWAYQRVSHEDAVLMYKLTQRAITQVGQLSVPDLGRAYITLAEARHDDPALLAQLRKVTLVKANTLSPSCLVDCVVGLAGLGCQDGELLEGLARWVANKLRNFSGAEVVASATAFAALRYHQRRLFETYAKLTVSTKLDKLRELSGQQLCSLVAAFATVRHHNTALLDRIAGRFVCCSQLLDELQPPRVAALMQCYSQLGHGHENLCSAAAGACLRQLRAVGWPRGALVDLVESLATLNCNTRPVRALLLALMPLLLGGSQRQQEGGELRQGVLQEEGAAAPVDHHASRLPQQPSQQGQQQQQQQLEDPAARAVLSVAATALADADEADALATAHDGDDWDVRELTRMAWAYVVLMPRGKSQLLLDMWVIRTAAVDEAELSASSWPPQLLDKAAQLITELHVRAATADVITAAVADAPANAVDGGLAVLLPQRRSLAAAAAAAARRVPSELRRAACKRALVGRLDSCKALLDAVVAVTGEVCGSTAVAKLQPAGAPNVPLYVDIAVYNEATPDRPAVGIDVVLEAAADSKQTERLLGHAALKQRQLAGLGWCVSSLHASRWKALRTPKSQTSHIAGLLRDNDVQT